MKRMEKFIVLFTMLLAGLSFKGANSTDKIVVADAAEAGSYAYLNSNWYLKNNITTALSEQGVSDISLIKTLLITNDGSNVTARDNLLTGCPVEVGRTGEGYTLPENYTNGCAVGAYLYPNATDTTMFDCVLYADVETIYAYYGANLFSEMKNVEKIKFDFLNGGKFSMANAYDHSMQHMFYYCSKLVQIEGFENIDITNVTNMNSLFAWCFSLTTIDMSHFDLSNVTNMGWMFDQCNALTTIVGLEKFNTSNVTNMSGMFSCCNSLTTLDVRSFDTSKVTDMRAMFSSCYKLTSIKGLETFDTSNVTDMSSMFNNDESLTTLDVSHFDTSNVTNMEYMFGWCKKLPTIKGLETFDTSKVTKMNCMFSYCNSLTTLDVSHFKTSNVTDMSNMFSSCDSLTELDVSSFKTSNVTNMGRMFDSCNQLTTIKGLETFDTSKVTDMSSMFGYCSNITALDLSNFDLSAITNNQVNNMLVDAYELTEIKAPKNLNGNTIQLPINFGMTDIDPSMEGWTLLQGSKEFNILYNTLMKINVCTEYAQAPELQAMYDGLSTEEKGKLATLTDDGGVILTDKLSYMVGYADYKANEATTASGTHLVLSARTGQYLVIVIACLSLTLIGGYYFIQKKKYAK